LIVVSVVAGFSSTIYGLHVVCRDFGLELVTKRNLVVLGALSLPAVAAWLAGFLPLSSITVKFLLGATVYLVSLVLPIVIERSKIQELIEITKSVELLGFIAPKILSTILIISNLLSCAKSKFSANKYG